MTKWAQVNNNGTLTDLTEIDPATIFHPDVAVHFEVVPDECEAHFIKDEEGNFAAPAVTEPVEVAPEIWLSEAEFLSKLTRAERQGISSARSSNADLDDFMTMMEKAGTVEVSDTAVQADINAFVTASLISQASADAIIPS